jgi:GH25 family lysozyme M1 (1,4-beta-N-acetylmuramidase)
VSPGLLRCALCAVLVGCVEPGGDPESSDDQGSTVCGDGPTVRGMDVSYYETSVDWSAAHAAGIDFAFIRVSDGLQFIDPRFPAYWDDARAAGVIRGAYQFFRPAEDPIAQADLLLDKIGPLAPSDLPPVIDVEVSGGLSTAEVAANVRAWVAHVTEAIGRPPIVYAGLYAWHDLTGSADETTSPLWVAQYTTAPCPSIPVPWTRWMFWQYTATGSVAGVSGSTLDLDVFNGTIDDLRGFASARCGDGQCSPGETASSCPADCPPCGTLGADGGIIDDGDACFLAGGPAQYLRHVAGSGDDGDLIWTHATPSATEANFAQWNLFFAEAGRYRVEAYTAHAYATSTRAAYVVQAGGARTTFAIDQTAVDGWQVLGELDFAAGGTQWIHLADNTGESTAAAAQLVFDAIRLTRIKDPTTPPIVDEPPRQTASAGCATAPGAGIAMIAALLGVRRRRRRASHAR